MPPPSASPPPARLLVRRRPGLPERSAAGILRTRPLVSEAANGRRKAGLIRSSVLFAGILLISLGLAGCGGDDASSSGSDVLTIMSVTPSPVGTPELVRFSFPIKDACLPAGDQLMPGAPRAYRQGTHEGIDFYEVDNCTAIGLGTEVLAAKDGEVVRVDSHYEELTQEDVDEMDARIAAQGETDEESLDRYRGRQVWIDHGAGVITRYAHLSRFADGLRVGMSVKRGEVIGYVGNSGTPESLIDPNAEMHLHFEIRVGDSYLGQGLTPEEVRALYESAFAQ